MPREFINHFYVIPDLGVCGSLDVRKFDTVQEAVAAYKELPTDKLKALGMTDTQNRPGSMDFVHCKSGVDILLSENSRIPSWNNSEVKEAVKYIRENIDLSEKLQTRFITPEYDTLFYLMDGEVLTMHYPNGMTRDATCHALPDEYHFKLGFNEYHICEFATLCRDRGITIEPLQHQHDLQLNTYEIYQVRDFCSCNYAFQNYDEAKKTLSSKDYRFVCAGMLGEKTTLDDLFQIYNGDSRPMSRQMRSLSVSDIIVLNKDGKSTAYYVNDLGFKEMRTFAHFLKSERLKQGIRLGEDRHR